VQVNNADPEHQMNRRRFLSAAAATAGVMVSIDTFLIEPELVEYTRHELNASKGATKSLRFVQLTDLHLGGIGSLERGIAEEVNRIEPDFIIVTDDSVDSRGGLGDLDTFLSLIARDIPKYAILGNWEYWGRVNIAALAEVYRRHNGRMLVNESIVHQTGAERLLLTGLDDWLAGAPSIERALERIEPEEHHIILAHCPMHRDDFLNYHVVEETRQWRLRPPVEMGRYNPRYMFSGHTHGGQVNLFGYTPWLPEGSGQYVKGWFNDGSPHLYVSRGIGTTIAPVRSNARPEVAVFTWYL
jgi:predicted MPP superfamily phosphohydrolase